MQLLLQRLSAQDLVLAEIRTEVKATNGQVKDLKARVARLEDERAALKIRLRDRVNLLAIFGSAVIAGTAGAIGHAVGAW